MVHTIVTKVRKCGRRKEGGVYVTGGDEGDPNGVLERFVLISPPIPYQVKFHRGPRIVDANVVLSRAPRQEWWIGSSRDTEEKKAGDQWALRVFGMTTTKRLSTGVCKGARSEEEAVSILASRVGWDQQAVHWFGKLTKDGVHDLPRIAAEYNTMTECMLRIKAAQTIDNIMDLQASVWRTAYLIPPSKRSVYVPNLVRMLVSIGLQEDAMALYTTLS